MKHFATLFIILAVTVNKLGALSTSEVQKKLKATTLSFLDVFKPGLCADLILNETVRRQYISKSLIGRVQPVGTFLTSQTALEYLFGILCEIPHVPSRGQVVETIDLLQLTYDPEYYRVAFKVKLNLKSKLNLIFLGFFSFDEQMKLCGYEAIIQNLGLSLDFDPSERPGLIEKLCHGIQAACPVGSVHQQYSDVNDCINFLSEPRTPFGTYDRADQNSAVCRIIHVQLSQLSPNIHCPHVGKSGGYVCTDKKPEFYFTGQTDFLQCAHRFRN